LGAPHCADAAEDRIGLIFTAFNAGLTLGAFGWGMLVDIIGVSSVPLTSRIPLTV
jgi:predicted MFS family arabinose efflux permease